MRLLLDECLPVELAAHLSGHVVRTAREMNWLGVKNGRLLKLIGDSGQFDAFITVDRNLPHQQNLQGLSFAVVILQVRSTRVSHVLAQVPGLCDALEGARQGKVIVIEIQHG